MGRENRDALSECIGIVNQAILKLELNPLVENDKEIIEGSDVEYPNKVTLKWLYLYVPWTFWVWLIGLLISAFSIGLVTSETDLYKSIKSGQDVEKNIINNSIK